MKSKKLPIEAATSIGKTREEHHAKDTRSAERAQGEGRSKEIPHGRLPRTFWHDPRVGALSGDAERLLIYLYASTQAWSIGFYRVSLGQAAEELRLSVKKVREYFAGLIAAGFVEWDAARSLVLMVEALGIQVPTSRSQAKGWAVHAVRWRDSPLFDRFLQRLFWYLKRRPQSVAHELPVMIADALEMIDGEGGRAETVRKAGVELIQPSEHPNIRTSIIEQKIREEERGV
jgi:hypothetical protein